VKLSDVNVTYNRPIPTRKGSISVGIVVGSFDDCCFLQFEVAYLEEKNVLLT
jgi:hypothetical protein